MEYMGIILTSFFVLIIIFQVDYGRDTRRGVKTPYSSYLCIVFNTQKKLYYFIYILYSCDSRLISPEVTFDICVHIWSCRYGIISRMKDLVLFSVYWPDWFDTRGEAQPGLSIGI